MTELTDNIFVEKYRPSCFEDLILKDKNLLLKYIKNPSTLPSFIFFSNKPGTGKTSLAKVIINTLDCDNIIINSSEERGIDVVRDKISKFAMGLSSNGIKKCVFLDEADGTTRAFQDSLRNIIETYSDNIFFIFSCNDLNKLIEPIISRCKIINFENPDKEDIYNRLKFICEKENIETKYLGSFIEHFYPDIRSMVKNLQELKLTGKNPLTAKEDFDVFLNAIEKKDINYVIQATYSNQFDIIAFNNWFFNVVFNESTKYGLEKCIEIADLLADTEKGWNTGGNLQIIFLANMFKLMKVL